MKKKNDIEVIINNKRYMLCGYESDEYLQKIASYINSKHDEFRRQEGYNVLDNEMKNILMQINIADDYFKAKTSGSSLTDELGQKDKEIFELKHEVISHKTRLDALMREKEQLEKDSLESQKKIIKLETELENHLERQKNSKVGDCHKRK